MINGKTFFDQPIKNSRRLFYFKNCYKMIAIDLRKQHGPDNDPKANQQINFAGNLN